MISDLVQSLSNMFANFFSWRTSHSNNEAMHEVIDDKKDLEKACNYAESAFKIVEEEAIFSEERYEEKYNNYVKKFRRYR